MALDFQIRLDPLQAAGVVDRYLTETSVTGEQIDQYILSSPEGRRCVVAVYEKHYYRAGNRLTVTVVLDDFSGTTRVHVVSGGGGEGLFRFDWGAADSFEDSVAEALADYRL